MPTKPDRLNPGDLMGVIAPASAPPQPKNIDRAIHALEQLGFRIKLGRNVRKRNGFLAGSDRERARDLMDMFADRKVKGILCVRGGYGTARLLGRLDYNRIASNPKIFIGYSDITSLHCAFMAKARLISFHGPMLNSDFAHENLPKFTLDSFLRTVSQPTPAGSIWNGHEQKTPKILRRGVAAGRLVGGNISILCATLGTPFQPPFRNNILFFEDVDEVPYRFDRMLTHLLNAGLLQQVAGIAIGVNHHCRDPKARGSTEYRQSLADVFRERLLPLGVPVVSGLPFGHIPKNATLPVGAKVLLDANRGDLDVLEPAVR